MVKRKLTNKIIDIVLTGGPCSGKSTALAVLTSWLMDLGFTVVVVPESATRLITSGISVPRYDDPMMFQQIILKDILHTDRLFKIAAQNMSLKSGKKIVVRIHDRGWPDIGAYIPNKKDFLELLRWGGLSLGSMTNFYDLAIHLVTAADGAEEYYTLDNNEARDEKPPEARALDLRNKETYAHHPALYVVDNSTDFRGKITRVKEALKRVLPVPDSAQFQRKFLVNAGYSFGDSLGDIPISHSVSWMNQIYLSQTEKIRYREQDGMGVYSRTVKTPPFGLERVETQKLIEPGDFQRLVVRMDPSTLPIRKLRSSFVWNNRCYRVDYFQDWPELCLMECDVIREDEEVEIPPFLSISREVTDKNKFYNYTIARRLRERKVA
ncbi:AAA family ATPase [Patescibacteria group bacterium]